MNLEILKGLALTGGNWVIDLLLLCSVLAVAVIVERGIVLAREARWLRELRDKLEQKLATSGDLDQLSKDNGDNNLLRWDTSY